MKRILARNCIISKGYKRTILCDLQRQKWWAFPNNIGEIIKNEDFDLLKLKYPDFYEVLMENDVILSIPKSDENMFTPIEIDYVTPSLIEHAIIDWEEGKSYYKVDSLIEDLINLGCKHLQLRFYNINDGSILGKVLHLIKDTTIEAIEVIMPYEAFVDNINYFLDLRKKNLRLKEILLFGCDPSNIPSTITNINWLSFIERKIIDCSSCGVISPAYFGLSIQHYSLTQSYNNCLYKKIGIDINGNIKNCPSSTKILGVLGQNSIQDIIHDEIYLELTKVKKSEIEVCKDCEFKIVCSDCRIYVDNSSNLYSRPSKCGYNPYIGKWKHENDYKSLLESGVISDEKGFMIDHGKIASTNLEVWGEE